MNEEENKITSVVKTEKNPGRVAAGKRLAAISKEAKERKKLERENAIKESLDNNDNCNNILVGELAVATVLVGAAVYFLKGQSEKSEPKGQHEKVTIEEEKPKPKQRPKRSFVPYSMADNP